VVPWYDWATEELVVQNCKITDRIRLVTTIDATGIHFFKLLDSRTYFITTERDLLHTTLIIISAAFGDWYHTYFIQSMECAAHIWTHYKFGLKHNIL